MVDRRLVATQCRNVLYNHVNPLWPRRTLHAAAVRTGWFASIAIRDRFPFENDIVTVCCGACGMCIDRVVTLLMEITDDVRVRRKNQNIVFAVPYDGVIVLRGLRATIFFLFQGTQGFRRFLFPPRSGRRSVDAIRFSKTDLNLS